MAKMLVSFLLDRTGSMSTVRDETITSFNVYLKELEKKTSSVFFTLTIFDSESVDVLHEAIPLADVPKLTKESYIPRAWTPLYDAVAKTILDVDAFLVKKRGFGGKKQRVLFVILTDGLENASTEYTREGVLKLVDEHTDRDWTFVYMGANQNAYAEGGKLGVPVGNIANFATGKIESTMRAAASATVSYAQAGLPTEDFWEDEDLEELK